MSDKTTCPGCNSRTSAIRQAVQDGEPCPYCGLPADVIWQVEGVRARQADETLKAEVERLLIENGKLTAERDRLARQVEQIRWALDEH